MTRTSPPVMPAASSMRSRRTNDCTRPDQINRQSRHAFKFVTLMHGKSVGGQAALYLEACQEDTYGQNRDSLLDEGGDQEAAWGPCCQIDASCCLVSVYRCAISEERRGAR